MSGVDISEIPDLRLHLLTRVLPFWAQHSLDRDFGGFITHLDRTGKITDPSVKYLVMQTRMIYSFAAGFAAGGPEDWLAAAHQGTAFFLRRFRDVQHDGWFWSVTRAGDSPVETRKRMYGHAFAVYALAEFGRIARDPQAVAAAAHTWSVVSQHLWDTAHEGVFEGCSREWIPTEPGHTMGTHLHTLEALLALNEAAGGNRYWTQARRVADLIVEHMVEPEFRCAVEHFHADWTPDRESRRALIDYGHNLEAAWLLLRVYRLDPEESYRETARDFLEYVLQNGLDTTYGGVYSHGHPGGPAQVREKVWWVQCEALPAFLLGYLIFRDERCWDAFRNVVDFCLQHLRDPEYGEWYHVTAEDGNPRNTDKEGAWKAAYHVTQALVYASSYLDEIASEH